MRKRRTLKYHLKHAIALIIVICISRADLFAQILFPLNHFLNQKIETSFVTQQQNFHSAFKPLIIDYEAYKNGLDTVLRYEKFDKGNNASYLMRKIFYESAIVVDTTDFKLEINPVFNFQLARDFGNQHNLTSNTRGVEAKGMVGQKLYFHTAFYENQAYFPDYITSFVNNNQISPGEGLVKPFKTNGYDFAWASGLLSYSPTSFLNLQFGHGKNFVGQGYRSLFLSDNTFNYPFLKVTSRWHNFQYTNLFASFINIKNAQSNGFDRKYASFHFLNYLNGKFQAGLFQSTIWYTHDSTNAGIKIKYLNPVILYEPLVNSLGARDNSSIGLNLKYDILPAYQLYGQFLIDDIQFGKPKANKGHYLNKNGFQVGVKMYNPLIINNLYVQIEYNNVRPYTYAHSMPTQNFAHYNQALAHPLGANFKEGLGIVNYRRGHILLHLKLVYAVYGYDSSAMSYGKDIFKSDNYRVPIDENETLQGIRTNLLYFNPEISYLLNPVTNMQISLGIVKRKLNNDLINNDLLFLYFAFRTNLNNIYYDF